MSSDVDLLVYPKTGINPRLLSKLGLIQQFRVLELILRVVR
jgi:hypothetical protein